MIQERSRQMLYDRDQGMTYREIGEKYGVSYQRVQQLIGGRKGNTGPFRPVKKCPYPNLKKWMNELQISRHEICRRVYGNTGRENYNRMCSYIRGDNDPPKRVIDKMIEATGMKYEVLFAREDENG